MPDENTTSSVSTSDVQRLIVTHRHPIEMAEREALEVREETDPQRADDALCDRRRQVAVEKRQGLNGGGGRE